MWWNKRVIRPEAEDDRALTDAAGSGDHRNAFIMLGLGGAVVAAFGIAAAAAIVAPVFFALVLTICVHPLRVALERRGVPRGIATGSVITAVTLLLLTFGYAVLVAFGQFANLLPEFADEIRAWGADVSAWLASLGIGTGEGGALFADFDASTLVEVVGGLVGGVVGATSALVIIFTMLLLMAMDAGYLPTLLRQTRPYRPLLVTALTGYATNVRRYMVVTTVLGLVQGAVNWLALVLLGVPGAFIWGLLAFLCSFIPNVGYFIAIIPPIIFGGLVGGWPTVIAVIVVYGLINAVVQSIIQPRVVGNAVALSQTITFFSVLLWAVVLGPIGAILAIPLTLLLRVVLVDANPKMAWIRPLLGELDETKALIAESTAAAKAERQARHESKRTIPHPVSPSPDAD
ncbi:MAG TPA: AI-2E family transporter [Agromyces sp.]|nr:AI-2E family transporter [Agromyces sp.]